MMRLHAVVFHHEFMNTLSDEEADAFVNEFMEFHGAPENGISLVLDCGCFAIKPDYRPRITPMYRSRDEYIQ